MSTSEIANDQGIWRSGDSTPLGAAPQERAPKTRPRKSSARENILRYGLAIVLSVLGHFVVAALWTHISTAPMTIYLATVVITSLYGGIGPGMLATLFASLDLDYSYMPPYGSFVVDFNNFLYLMAFFSVALVTSYLQGQRRRAEESLRAAHEELERRVLERTAELVRSREQFSLLVNGVSDQAFFMVDPQGQIASWNSGAERLIGFTEHEIVGRHFTHIWPDGLRVEKSSADNGASGPNDQYEYQDWIIGKNGSRFWGCVFLTHVEDELGQPRGRAMAVRDITERRSLERDILDISERERLRIGHDLHDGLGQELTGVAMLGTALAEQLAADQASGAEQAEHIADLVHESIQHTRELARGLCPLDLEDEGLPAALRQLANRLAKLPRLQCHFDSPAHIRVDATTGSHLYRIAQEAINNAVRHGKAGNLTVRLNKENGVLSLVVSDDGIGIPDPQPSSGMGLRLMRYRAQMIRGALDIRRSEQGGTIVTCTVREPETPGHA